MVSFIFFLVKLFLMKYLPSEMMACIFDCECFVLIHSKKSLFFLYIWLGPLEFTLAIDNRRDPLYPWKLISGLCTRHKRRISMARAYPEVFPSGNILNNFALVIFL